MDEWHGGVAFHFFVVLKSPAQNGKMTFLKMCIFSKRVGFKT
jgi:hypothetical protein